MAQRALRMAIRIAATILVLLVIASTAATLGVPSATAAEAATLTVYTGTARIVHPGQAPRAAHTGDGVADGESVVTGASSKASLEYADGSVTRLDSETVVEVHVTAATAGGLKTQLVQSAGLTWNSVKQLLGGSSFQVAGPNSAIVGVRGTEFGYYVEYDAQGNPVIWVDTWNGVVQVQGAVGPPVSAGAGTRVTVRVGAAPTVPVPIPADDRRLSFTVFNQALDVVSGTVVAATSGTLSQGAISGASTVTSDGRSDYQFVVGWPGSTYSLMVLDPAGRVLRQQASAVPPFSVVIQRPPEGKLTYAVTDVQSAPNEHYWVLVGRS